MGNGRRTVVVVGVMDQELVRRAVSGDHEAFSQVATNAFEALFRTARLILRDDDMAADAVQDALLSAWLHIRAVRDPVRFESWLRRLLVRACYAQAARARRHRTIELQIDEVDVVGGVSAEIQDRHAMRDQLDRGFRRLSLDHRAVLVAHHYLGLPDLEASTMLGIPIGTYKSRLNRATAAMRAALEADGRSVARGQESLA
jgi:RNA polymerase sigma-70 factor (ECF subfamily)